MLSLSKGNGAWDTEDRAMPSIELVFRWRNWEVRVKLTFLFKQPTGAGAAKAVPVSGS